MQLDFISRCAPRQKAKLKGTQEKSRLLRGKQKRERAGALPVWASNSREKGKGNGPLPRKRKLTLTQRAIKAAIWTLARRQSKARRFFTMSYTVVFFDLETTGLDTQKCDIIQIAAVCNRRVFNTYVVPRCALTKEASDVTGFSLANGCLFRHGKPMDTVPLRQALDSFMEFLSSFCGPLYLAAHNANRFDAPVLNRVLREFSLLHPFQSVVFAYLDTFLLSKRMFRNFYSYSLAYMVQYFLEKSYDAHNALEDARMLQELFQVWKPGRNVVLNCLI
ncbi:DNA polymerase III subunit epsilon-like [Syngnathus acus]|uniref:DNA polymerase III subunit epsilon-like n=1 Tax=Syngnathus acus TaxID=161584 RepID=UPI001885D4A7|nr:DNA polymerase III subunit epsilon-like [Syngnathus acus]